MLSYVNGRVVSRHPALWAQTGLGRIVVSPYPSSHCSRSYCIVFISLLSPLNCSSPFLWFLAVQNCSRYEIYTPKITTARHLMCTGSTAKPRPRQKYGPFNQQDRIYAYSSWSCGSLLVFQSSSRAAPVPHPDKERLVLELMTVKVTRV